MRNKEKGNIGEQGKTIYTLQHETQGKREKKVDEPKRSTFPQDLKLPTKNK